MACTASPSSPTHTYERVDRPGTSRAQWSQKTWRTASLVGSEDPWGWGASLEWATSCPPPRHNFDTIPRIRSERPAFDLHHPEAAPVVLAPAPATVATVTSARSDGAATDATRNR